MSSEQRSDDQDVLRHAKSFFKHAADVRAASETGKTHAPRAPKIGEHVILLRDKKPHKIAHVLSLRSDAIITSDFAFLPDEQYGESWIYADEPSEKEKLEAELHETYDALAQAHATNSDLSVTLHHMQERLESKYVALLEGEVDRLKAMDARRARRPRPLTDEEATAGMQVRFNVLIEPDGIRALVAAYEDIRPSLPEATA